MSKNNKEQSDSVKPINVISFEVTFDNPIKDVHTARAPLSSCGWINTTEGVVLIDTLLAKRWAKQVKERIKDKIKYLIYTHGHMDHILAAPVFMDDNPEVIASKYLPDRLDKYQMLAPYKARKDAQQFGFPKLFQS